MKLTIEKEIEIPAAYNPAAKEILLEFNLITQGITKAVTEEELRENIYFLDTLRTLQYFRVGFSGKHLWIHQFGVISSSDRRIGIVDLSQEKEELAAPVE